jgi:hypothetical protein
VAGSWNVRNPDRQAADSFGVYGLELVPILDVIAGYSNVMVPGRSSGSWPGCVAVFKLSEFEICPNYTHVPEHKWKLHTSEIMSITFQICASSVIRPSERIPGTKAGITFGPTSCTGHIDLEIYQKLYLEEHP